MKKQPRKLDLHRETVRQLDRFELSAAGGGILTTFSFATCVDCPSVHVACNTTPKGGVQ
jgi:hypothetical protein